MQSDRVTFLRCLAFTHAAALITLRKFKTKGEVFNKLLDGSFFLMR